MVELVVLMVVLVVVMVVLGVVVVVMVLVVVEELVLVMVVVVEVLVVVVLVVVLVVMVVLVVVVVVGPMACGDLDGCVLRTKRMDGEYNLESFVVDVSTRVFRPNERRSLCSKKRLF